MDVKELDFMAIVTSGIGAFLGAYFAFVFLRIADHLRRVYDRQKKHHEALVRFEHELNNYLTVIADNIYLIERFRKTVNDKKIYWSLPRTLPIYRELVIDLANLRIVNELSTLNTTLRKINDDIESVTGAYGEIKNAYIAGRLNQDGFKDYASPIADGLETLKKAFQALQNRIVNILALIRAQAPKDNPSGRILLYWSVKSSDVSEDKIEGQRKVLLAEMEISRKKSREEIESTLGPNG